ncbi:MAG: hypothetical protein ACE5GW_07425, partial [Planctomycetota bacterium]
MELTLGRAVAGLESAPGEFIHGSRCVSGEPEGQAAVFHQILNPEIHSIAFEPGRPTVALLTNDQ